MVTAGAAVRGVVKPLADEAVTTTSLVCPGASVLSCRAALPLSRAALVYLAGVIRRYRRQAGSCWRTCAPGQQALLVLAHPRKGEASADLAAGSGIGTATAWRYVREAVTLLAARAPGLRGALRAANKPGHVPAVTGGTLIPIGRVAADRPSCSGKNRRHGMNLQVISSPQGRSCGCPAPCPALPRT